MLPWIAAAVAAIVVVWVFVVRPLIRDLPAFDAAFDRIEAFERLLWSRSRTVLVARLYWVPGLIDLVTSWAFDWTPLVARAFEGVPDDLRGLVISAALAVTGALFEWLRRVTSEPVTAKE